MPLLPSSKIPKIMRKIAEIDYVTKKFVTALEKPDIKGKYCTHPPANHKFIYGIPPTWYSNIG